MKIYGSIEKTESQDDGTIKVWGYASSEVVDSSGEVVTSEAMKAAIPEYMAFGAVREMHDAKKAAGTAIEIEVQEDGRTYFGAHVVDSEAVRKVQHGVYKGFSIGGKVLLRDEVQKNTITGLKLSEISLVDRPANPEAKFTMFKADSAETHDLRKYAGEEVFDARVALDCLSDILWLLDTEQSEVEDYPEQIAALKAAIAALKAFIVSEIQEDNSPSEKAAAEVTVDLEKTGKEISASNNQKLQEISDILVSMGVVPGPGKAEKADGQVDDIRKIDELQDSFSDLQKRHDALEDEARELRESNEAIMKAAGAAGAEAGAEVTEFIARQAVKIQRLEEMPEAPKAVLKAVGKAEDSFGHEAPGTEDVVKNVDGSVNEVASELKKIHRTGGYVAR